MQGSTARTSIAVLLLAASVVATGCYSYHIHRVGGPDGRELGNQPSTVWEKRTLHSFLWGLVRQDQPVENCRTGAGDRLNIEEVKIDTNLAYLAASVATLGIWVPLEVSWRCAKPPVPTNQPTP